MIYIRWGVSALTIGAIIWLICPSGTCLSPSQDLDKTPLAVTLGATKGEVENCLGEPDLIEPFATAWFYYYFSKGCLLEISRNDKVGVTGISFFRENKYFKSFAGRVMGIAAEDAINAVKGKLISAKQRTPEGRKERQVRPFPRDSDCQLEVKEILMMAGSEKESRFDFHFAPSGKLVVIQQY